MTPSAAAVADRPGRTCCDLSAGRRDARCARGGVGAGVPSSTITGQLRKIPGIGRWTVDMLALYGQGRYDVIPAGDLGFLKTVGRALSGGDPKAYATEDDVRSFFARYDPWAGLAGLHFLLG
jgi:3-methyladenine DNA glycosylase/8-oxoguanine DNA glycosylase